MFIPGFPLDSYFALSFSYERLRTERRLAQLRQEQRQLEYREVLTLFALIWVVGIVLFYTGLYLRPLN